MILDLLFKACEPWFPTLSQLHPVPLWNTGYANPQPSRIKTFRTKKFDAAKEPFVFRWYQDIRMTAIPGEETSRCLFLEGYYEPNAFSYLDKLLKPGMVLIDGGANAGVFTLFAASKVGDHGKVFSFEPSRREFQKLSKNIRINRFNNIEISQKALWHRPGTVELHIAQPPQTGHNTLGKFAYAGTAESSVEKVEAFTLDDWARDKKLSRLDVLKLDLEGAEDFVLQGSWETLKKFRPIVLIEIFDPALKSFGCDHQKIWKRLLDLNYRFFCYSPKTGCPEAVSTFPGDLFTDFIVCPEEKTAAKFAGLV